MRRPSLTRNTVGDLEIVAMVAKSTKAGGQLPVLTPRGQRRLDRGLAYIEALAQWSRSREQGATEAEAAP